MTRAGHWQWIAIRRGPSPSPCCLGAQGENFPRGSESRIELGSGLQQAGAVADVLFGTLNKIRRTHCHSVFSTHALSCAVWLNFSDLLRTFLHSLCSELFWLFLHSPALSLSCLDCLVLIVHNRALPCLVRLILGHPALSYLVLYDLYAVLHILRCPALPYLLLYCPEYSALSCLVLHCPLYSVHRCPALSCLVMHCPAILHRTCTVLQFLSCPALPFIFCTILRCSALFCLVLHCPAYSAQSCTVPHVLWS